MNCPPEHSGCWYCMTDFDSPLGWLDSDEFDCVLHVECLEYEFNELQHRYKNDLELIGDAELYIFMKEFGYELVD